jgi:glycosyltransferase involved in cell wall biosynthesis
MSRPTLAVVHNNVDGRSAIGAFAEWAVREGIDRGWDVHVVCRDLDPTLRGEVTVHPLYVPPRLHLVQWSVARPTVRRALGGWRPDAMLVYQPQIAALADVWHVQYLSRAARLAQNGIRRPGVRGAISDVQAAGVATLEDRYLRRIPSTTRVLFCSEGLRDRYAELIGRPANYGVLHNPALLPAPPVGTDLPDLQRRAELTGGHVGPVLGFLGGGDPRKGGDLIVEAMRSEPDLFLLHAGPYPLDDHLVRGRSRSLGHLTDVTELLDVVDVLMVPSRFEPFGLVIVEAAARGVPVLFAPGVGAGPLVAAEGAGEEWVPGSPLGPAVHRLIRQRATTVAACARVIARVDPSLVADQLFDALEFAARAKRQPE